MENVEKFYLILCGILFLIFCLFFSIGIISAGERGVKTRFGAITGLVEPGLYFKIPFIEKVKKIDIKTRTINYDKGGDNGDEIGRAHV